MRKLFECSAAHNRHSIVGRKVVAVVFKLEKIERNLRDPAAPNKETSEEYWLDMEGLEHRDTVTDFNLPEGTFFDTATVHILTTATLQRLHELYPESRFAVPRFRPNVVVSPTDGSSGFVENAWLGRIIAIGESVRLKIDLHCALCVMTTLAQEPGPKAAAAESSLSFPFPEDGAAKASGKPLPLALIFFAQDVPQFHARV